ncbi:GNAT family N-acetyltransferase [Streptococcus sp. 121]|uniref:GNAT family N-acetyltransferase n=1 Tax=Streptococcus sp. 121 TaxID=2797637 RepID=UPI0018F08366|nr:GNAT family protein [Streptococcus sp. 121]MBJ6746067.1 GNAT family N-acetyltransferase [Streptococcus sp. 121]
MTSHELTIEEAQDSDAGELLEFFKQVASESDLTSLEPGGLDLSQDQLADYLESSANHPSRLFLLARLDQEVIGILHLSTDANPRMSHVGEVFVAVGQAYWGHGVGGMLFELVFDWLAETPSLRRLTLNVQERNQAARALYEKFGFSYEGRQEEAIRLEDGSYETVLLMGLLIDRENHV